MDFKRRWSLGSLDGCALNKLVSLSVCLSVCQLSVDIIMVGTDSTKYAHMWHVLLRSSNNLSVDDGPANPIACKRDIHNASREDTSVAVFCPSTNQLVLLQDSSYRWTHSTWIDWRLELVLRACLCYCCLVANYTCNLWNRLCYRRIFWFFYKCCVLHF